MVQHVYTDKLLLFKNIYYITISLRIISLVNYNLQQKNSGTEIDESHGRG